MFADACEKMTRCTRPIISSALTVGGTLNSTIGSFVVINREGWALTAAHIVEPARRFRADSEQMRIAEEAGESPDPSLLRAQSFWWSWDGVTQESMHVYPDVDLAVVKLSGFRPEMIQEYPVFKDPTKMRIGMSICRIGFPFVRAVTSYDSESGRFLINKGVLPVPFFPNDGIFTRTLNGPSKEGREYDALFVETSSPGLRGQSGGPVFDRKGYIAAIQTTTAHMDMGFDSVHAQDGTVVAKQFLNVGIGVHVKTVMQILDRLGIRYKSEADDDGYRIVS